MEIVILQLVTEDGEDSFLTIEDDEEIDLDSEPDVNNSHISKIGNFGRLKKLFH